MDDVIYIYKITTLDNIEASWFWHWRNLRTFLKVGDWKMASQELDEMEKIIEGIRKHVKTMLEQESEESVKLDDRTAELLAEYMVRAIKTSESVKFDPKQEKELKSRGIEKIRVRYWYNGYYKGATLYIETSRSIKYPAFIDFIDRIKDALRRRGLDPTCECGWIQGGYARIWVREEAQK